MPLAAGTLLGPYEILAPLGSGGMGEVFRARDTRLDRSVAIKVLRSDLPADAERRTRFEREAKAIAALTHPHICTLYDIGRAELPGAADGIAFLVMELIEGETLADRIGRGALSLPEALSYGMQIADALDRAHRHGIVHRDLKPGNIMLTRGGAKLLDFGLARLRADRESALEQATRTSPVTGDGVVLGTLQYMAPEQLEGRQIDQRADVFALGAILYEMVSGRRAFEASSAAGVISAILGNQPAPLSQVTPVAPPSLERIVSTALAKNPDHRWASAQDVRLMLEQVVEETPATGAAASKKPNRREWIAWTAAAAALTLAAVLGLAGTSRDEPRPVDVLSIVPSDGTTLTQGEAPRISPNGRLIAFVGSNADGRTGLYVRDRRATESRLLPETDDATLPFWSPDSQRLGYFAAGRLVVVDVDGGKPRPLASAPVPRGGTWNQNNTILFVPYPNEPPHTISAEGGKPTPVPAGPEGGRGRWFPSFLPDGRHYIYLATGSNRVGDGIRLASLDHANIKNLVPTRASALVVPPGYLLYRRDESLLAQRFDVDTLELEGAPVTIVERIGFNPITYQALFSASNNAELAYAASGGSWQLVWFDMQGQPLEALTPPGGYNSLCLSADGKHLIYDEADSRTGDVDLWSLDLASRTPSRLTFDPAVDFLVACSPRENEAAFSSLRGGMPQLHRVAIAAPGGEKALLPVTVPIVPTDWSRDGRHILYSAFAEKTSWDIWVLPLDGGEPYTLAGTPTEERNARFSPDGRWIAYASDQGGTLEISVRPFANTTARWQISRGGGRQPLWRPDGKQLFYISPDRKIIAVDVNTSGGTFSAGASRAIGGTRIGGWESTNQATPYAVTSDGKRFLINNAAEVTSPIHVMLNWSQVFR